jgi:hypothetical protein
MFARKTSILANSKSDAAATAKAAAAFEVSAAAQNRNPTDPPVTAVPVLCAGIPALFDPATRTVFPKSTRNV